MHIKEALGRAKQWHRTARHIGQADGHLWFEYAAVLLRHVYEVVKERRAHHGRANGTRTGSLWQRFVHATHWAAARAAELAEQRTPGPRIAPAERRPRADETPEAAFWHQCTELRQHLRECLNRQQWASAGTAAARLLALLPQDAEATTALLHIQQKSSERLAAEEAARATVRQLRDTLRGKMHQGEWSSARDAALALLLHAPNDFEAQSAIQHVNQRLEAQRRVEDEKRQQAAKQRREADRLRLEAEREEHERQAQAAQRAVEAQRREEPITQSFGSTSLVNPDFDPDDFA